MEIKDYSFHLPVCRLKQRRQVRIPLLKASRKDNSIILLKEEQMLSWEEKKSKNSCLGTQCGFFLFYFYTAKYLLILFKN